MAFSGNKLDIVSTLEWLELKILSWYFLKLTGKK